jgi:Fur family peroxide stress response transcriptional regulator
MNYIELLNNHDLKATPQRISILDNLHKMGHLNIDQLYSLLKSSFPAISLATIYKNMHAMGDKCLVEEIKIPNSKSVYEIKKNEHSHVVCSKCHEISDIELNTNDLLKEAEVLSNFSLDKSAIVFNGICPNCAA